MTAPKPESWSRLSLAKLREKAADHRIEVPEGATKAEAYQAILRGLQDRLDPELDEETELMDDDEVTEIEGDGIPVSVALALIAGDLPAIPKSGRAPGAMGGYSYQRVEDIKAALKHRLAAAEIVILPSVLDRRDGERTTGKGAVLFVADLFVEFRFKGRVDEELVQVWGQGTDSGDKAVQKAMTSAWKTMAQVVFNVSDTDDAEEFDVPETVRPRPATRERIDALVVRVNELDLGDWVKDQAFPWPWSDAVCDAVEAKIAPEVAATEHASTVCPVCGNPIDAHEENCPERPF